MAKANLDEMDARPILDRTVRQVSALHSTKPAHQDALVTRYLRNLTETDYQILRLHKLNMKHRQIAKIMSMDVDSVRRSLMHTYSELSMRMYHGSGDDGNGEPAPLEYRRTG